MPTIRPRLDTTRGEPFAIRARAWRDGEPKSGDGGGNCAPNRIWTRRRTPFLLRRRSWTRSSWPTRSNGTDSIDTTLRSTSPSPLRLHETCPLNRGVRSDQASHQRQYWPRDRFAPPHRSHEKRLCQCSLAYPLVCESQSQSTTATSFCDPKLPLTFTCLIRNETRTDMDSRRDGSPYCGGLVA